MANAGSSPAHGYDNPRSDATRLNQIQAIGSHNSYHLEVSAAEKAIRIQQAPDNEHEFEFTASPLAEQLSSQNVRQVEFDVWADPDGGLFANPLLRQLAGLGAYEPAMAQPGTKVLHAQDVDYYSRCLTLVSCLRGVKSWSDSHPSHMPIAILLEFNDDPLWYPGTTEVVPGTVVPVEWTKARMVSLENELLSVFPRNRIITPDDVRKPGKTLEQSIKTDGWPTIGSSRGKVMFLMDQKDFDTKYRNAYVAGNPSLEGRLMFSQSTPGQPDAAFLKRYVWDAGGPAEITNLVRQGYLVRTRADADTLQARANDTTDRDAALASGAQWVSTDYPAPGLANRWGSPYYVAIPGGTVARCNPVLTVSVCRSSAIEPKPARPRR
ncbi:phosphatidylinositol-specific phospholipase C1-like protein [Actinophytocola oryzae]|uniref:phosphatidylinositol-specific phospholipase C1-like protein n=1 Tax=Actinophytocola oryzae TaxID=502181 RepID=UPI001FBBF776|nr:phosphatidylinositol-specific phospholipase C1-like protein [Actinophytocola oryzae]